jgi:endoglucanase
MSRFIVLLWLALTCVSTVNAQQPKMPEGFNIQHGVSISHWLSQTAGRNGVTRADYFTEKDVAFIASKGFDHIRIPVDESELWDYKNEKDRDAFKALNDALGWCKQYKLRAIVDLQNTKSHNYDSDVKPLWTDDDAQDRFIECWRQLSAELKKFPDSQVAYELLNGPVADSADQWNRLAARCIAMIREQEPRRILIVGSNQGENYNTLADLKVPAGDTHIILSFHYYNPVYFTQYRSPWVRAKDYDGPVHYPGATITERELNDEPATIRNLLPGSTRKFDEDTMHQQMEVPLKTSRKLRLPLYCSEWGAMKTAPRKDRLRWYRDMREAFDKIAVAWCVWDYKGEYGIVGDNGDPDDKLIKILTQ